MMLHTAAHALAYRIARRAIRPKAPLLVPEWADAFRQRLENLPHRIAPEIVGKDLDAIRATLKQEVFGALAEMEREFSKQLEIIGSEE